MSRRRVFLLWKFFTKKFWFFLLFQSAKNTADRKKSFVELSQVEWKFFLLLKKYFSEQKNFKSSFVWKKKNQKKSFLVVKIIFSEKTRKKYTSVSYALMWWVEHDFLSNLNSDPKGSDFFKRKELFLLCAEKLFVVFFCNTRFLAEKIIKFDLGTSHQKQIFFQNGRSTKQYFSCYWRAWKVWRTSFQFDWNSLVWRPHYYFIMDTL